MPEGILCDGGSSVVWHADLSTTRSGVRIPPSAGRPTEINHNKSERKVQQVEKKTVKKVQKGQKRSKKVQRPQNRFFSEGGWINYEGGG